MLPTLEVIRQLPSELVREFMELNYNPLSLAVVRRALQLGLDELVPPDGIAIDELRTRVDATPTSLDMTLRLGAGFRLFEIHGERVLPGILTRTFLAPTAPMPLRGQHTRYVRALDAVGALRDALESIEHDNSTMYTSETSERDQEKYFENRRAWDRANREYFVHTAAVLARAHATRDLSRHHTVMDIGAGPATFLCILKQAFPHLRAIAADISYKFPDVLAEIEAIVKSTGQQVELVEHNFLAEVRLAERVDLITFNRVLSGVPSRARPTWLRRALDHLEPGGVLAVADFCETGEPDHDRTIAMLFALSKTWTFHRLRTTPPAERTGAWAGEGWTPPLRTDELAAQMREVGFVDVQWHTADAPFAIVEGRRP